MAASPGDKPVNAGRRAHPAGGIVPDTPESVVALDAKSRLAERKHELERDRFEHDSKQQQATSAHRHRKEWVLLWAGIALGAATCVACLFVIFGGGYPDDLRKAAMAGLFSMLSAILGFIAGKGSRGES